MLFLLGFPGVNVDNDYGSQVVSFESNVSCKGQSVDGNSTVSSRTERTVYVSIKTHRVFCRASPQDTSVVIRVDFEGCKRVRMREEVASIDLDSFYEFASKFAARVRHLTKNRRNILSIYDAYRSHMTLRTLQHLVDGNVVVYALTAHTSGKTLPLDSMVFGVFRQEFNPEISTVAIRRNNNAIDVYELCALLRYAFYRSCTHSNVVSSFSSAGLRPNDHARLLSEPRPKSKEDQSTLLSISEMEKF